MNALNVAEYTHSLGLQAKTASALMAKAPAAIKNKALKALARLLRENVASLQIDNAKDLERAVANGLAEPMVDRLKLSPKVLETCAEGCEQLAAMPDIIGEILGMKQQPSGIRVGQMRVPIGVFGMIYESRPDVTIPRGGKGLIERISRDAKVPVIKHLDGNCHTYVDDPCDIAMAVKVADNAKTNKYSPCNASEGLLVARGVAAEFLPQIGVVYAAKGVEMRGCPESLALLADVPGALLTPATEQDWSEEYLAPIISVKVVAGVDEAIAHINHYSSHHTDAILTRDHMHAQQFLREVDSASVMVNASTRFADGFEYGLGAEIGISTDKFHARGPVGIEGLTSLKYVVLGEGEVRG